MTAISLRKANATQASILAYIAINEVAPTVSINEFDGLHGQLFDAKSKFTKYMREVSTLTNILYEIRTKVSKANSNSGIDDVLTAMARFDKRIAFSKAIVAYGPRVSDEVLEGRIAKQKKEVVDTWSRTADITTSVLNAEEVSALKVDIAVFTKAKAKLQDSLLTLNVETKIRLEDASSDFLEKLNIL